LAAPFTTFWSAAGAVSRKGWSLRRHGEPSVRRCHCPPACLAGGRRCRAARAACRGADRPPSRRPAP